MPKGVHNNHVRGPAHYRWRGGNPPPDPAKRRANAKASDLRHPERRRARERVKDAVRAGRLPRAKDVFCVDCGCAADSYDHPRGYEPPFDLDVEPVCYRCHGLRSRERGEHKGPRAKSPVAGGRELDGREWTEFPVAAALKQGLFDL